tara:strand:+ start:3065 stop:3250 length:186 start_codon:yes stop_codon:yes gene_type:complete
MIYVNARNTPCIVRVDGEAKVLQPGDEVISETCLLKYGLKAKVEISPPRPIKKKIKKTTKE